MYICICTPALGRRRQRTLGRSGGGDGAGGNVRKTGQPPLGHGTLGEGGNYEGGGGTTGFILDLERRGRGILEKEMEGGGEFVYKGG